MDFSKTRLIESIFAGGGETAARMRARNGWATLLGPLLSARLAARTGKADAVVMRIRPETEPKR